MARRGLRAVGVMAALLLVAGAAPYAVDLDARRCVAASAEWVAEMEWQAFAAFVQRCPVVGPDGKVELDVLTIRVDRMGPAPPRITIPKAEVVDLEGRHVADLGVPFPSDPGDGRHGIRFKNWRGGFPWRIELAGDGPLVWDPQTRLFKPISEPIPPPAGDEDAEGSCKGRRGPVSMCPERLYRFKLDPTQCEAASPGLLAQLGAAWQAVAPYVQECTVKSPLGRVALTVDTVRMDWMQEAGAFENGPVSIPDPVFRNRSGRIIGGLNEVFPIALPSAIQVTFADWRRGFPRRVILYEAGESAAAPHPMPSLRWDGRVFR